MSDQSRAPRTLFRGSAQPFVRPPMGHRFEPGTKVLVFENDTGPDPWVAGVIVRRFERGYIIQFADHPTPRWVSTAFIWGPEET